LHVGLRHILPIDRGEMDDQGTCLWTLRRGGREVACIVRLVPAGIEVDIAYDGAPVMTRAFADGEEALDWAEKTKADRQERGWL
jgi:hypothetical protein